MIKFSDILNFVKKETSIDQFYECLPNELIKEIEENFTKEDFYNIVINNEVFEKEVFITMLNRNHEKEELETLNNENGKSLLSEYTYDISTIEYLLNIKVNREEIVCTCNILLNELRPNYLFNSNDIIDLSYLQGYSRQEILNARNFTYRYLHIIITAINYTIFKTYFDTIPNNRQRKMQQKIRELDTFQDNYKQVAQNIKSVLLSIKTKIELPIVFDSVIDKYSINCRHLSKSKKRIELFDFLIYKNF